MKSAINTSLNARYWALGEAEDRKGIDLFKRDSDHAPIDALGRWPPRNLKRPLHRLLRRPPTRRRRKIIPWPLRSLDRSLRQSPTRTRETATQFPRPHNKWHRTDCGRRGASPTAR